MGTLGSALWGWQDRARERPDLPFARHRGPRERACGEPGADGPSGAWTGVRASRGSSHLCGVQHRPTEVEGPPHARRGRRAGLCLQRWPGWERRPILGGNGDPAWARRSGRRLDCRRLGQTRLRGRRRCRVPPAEGPRDRPGRAAVGVGWPGLAPPQAATPARPLRRVCERPGLLPSVLASTTPGAADAGPSRAQHPGTLGGSVGSALVSEPDGLAGAAPSGPRSPQGRPQPAEGPGCTPGREGWGLRSGLGWGSGYRRPRGELGRGSNAH